MNWKIGKWFNLKATKINKNNKATVKRKNSDSKVLLDAHTHSVCFSINLPSVLHKHKSVIKYSNRTHSHTHAIFSF